MTRNIHDLTNLLKDVRIRFIAKFTDASESKSKELAELNNDYINGSPTYERRKEEIEISFNEKLLAARSETWEKVTGEIECLRQLELGRITIVNEDALRKIGLLKDIPLTAVELQQILDKYGTSYLAKRMIAAKAEECGVPLTDLEGVDAPADVKISVLDQLEKQTSDFLQNYDGTSNTIEARDAKFLLLSDSVLNNAVNIYAGGKRELAEADAVAKAYAKINALGSQMAKACAISTSLRNLKGEDAKNALLYRLSTNETILQEAYEVAGIGAEMEEWKHGKADRYVESFKIIDSIRTEQNAETIKKVLRPYADADRANEFLPGKIRKVYKENSCVAKAVAELDAAERETLKGKA